VFVSIENLAVFGVLSMVFTLVIGFVLAALLDRKVPGRGRVPHDLPLSLRAVLHRHGLVWQWILNPQPRASGGRCATWLGKLHL
jgi:glucose/mannose transport system permease protein